VTETETETDPTVTEPAAAPKEEAPEPDTGDELEGEEEEAAEPAEPAEEEEIEFSAPPQPVDDFEVLAGQKSQSYWEKTVGPRIVAEWGDSAKYLLECPLCMTTHKGFVDARDQGRYPPQIVKAIQEFMGISQEVEYVQDEETRTCPRCEGYGQTSTGSKVPTQLKHTCSLCAGYGFVPPPSGSAHPSPSGALPDNGTSPVLAPPVDDFGKPDVDNWQEPRILPDGRENPNYGRQPSFKVLVDPWGITAGLGAQDA
jgi:hypothetical protein